MTTLAARTMAQRLTEPFAPGADTLLLTLLDNDIATAPIAPYIFNEHQARFDRTPAPRYVLTAQQDIPVATAITLAYDVINPLNPNQIVRSGSVTVIAPAGMPRGESLLLNLGADEGPDTRLRRLTTTPAMPRGMAADWWRITALLGNMAKLLWIVGWEKDSLGRMFQRVSQQRALAAATGASLDLLGSDLGVPRFPPLPYAFDEATVALYHLDDVLSGGQSKTTLVEDSMGRYPGKTAHPGVNQGAQSGAVGRFGRGFAFVSGAIEVANHADFALAAADSFTLECFIRPEAHSADGYVLTKHANPADAAQSGWALSVGEFGRGLPRNVRLLLRSGATLITLFADASLPEGRFTHVAGVIDRASQQARLYLDGALHAQASISGLGALTNTAPVRIGGTAGANFQGALDEVRLSRAALSAFFPALGEPDESYRRRLRLFERWTLPTRENLQQILNETVGPIGGDAQPLILDDADATLLSGVRTLTITPVTLQPGERIAASGQRWVEEAPISGVAADELTFDPVFLLSHNDGRVIYAPAPPRALQPGELPPDAHKMQLVVERALNRLLDLVQGHKLRIESAFDPRANDLRSVGRALTLTSQTVTSGRLAALAHQAGFSFVHYQTNGQVYASMAPGEYIELRIASSNLNPPQGVDLLVGQTATLDVRPALPPDTLYQWLTIDCGAGRVSFTSGASGPTITLQATQPGRVALKVEVTRRRRTFAGSRTLLVSPTSLDDGQSIGADGALGVSEQVAGPVDPFFHPAYLITRDDNLVQYGANLDNRRMQPAVALCLTRLTKLLVGQSGQLTVAEAYTPGAAELRGVGRALTLAHSTLAAAQLGVLAHRAGFSYVRRQGAQILVRHQQTDPVTISGPDSVEEGGQASLSLLPRAAPRGLAISATSLFTANHGTDTLSQIDRTTGRVTRVIKVGWRPAAVAVKPDGTTLYSADNGGATVSVVLAGATKVSRTIAVQTGPFALAHHPTAELLYVLCQNGMLQAINTQTQTVTNTLDLGGAPVGFAIRPGGGELWVALAGPNVIRVVTTATMTTATTINLSQAPHSIAIAPNDALAYVTLPAGQLVAVTISTRAIAQQFNVGVKPGPVAVAPNSQTIFVIDQNPAAEQLLALQTNGALRDLVRIRREPVALIATAERVYIANRRSDDIGLVNLQGELGLIDTWRLGSGLGEALIWSLRSGGAAQAELSSTTAAETEIEGRQAGPLLARAIYSLRDQTDPYTFAVRLKPALEQNPAIVIRKQQYDLLMNIVNAFHPIGVEVSTRAIRLRVIEVGDQLINAFPDYTYPNFRVRGAASRRPKE